jgi:hypothetical protein
MQPHPTFAFQRQNSEQLLAPGEENEIQKFLAKQKGI